MADLLLTVNEVAENKGVTRSAVYAAIKEGRLQPVRVLGRLGLREADVAAWVPKANIGRPPGIPMSEDAKRRIAESQKQRWARRQQSPSE